jgi:hypothetical protein
LLEDAFISAPRMEDATKEMEKKMEGIQKPMKIVGH